ncbi:MAG: nuclear transport factor 2 family protein [Aquincola sp.]|nr:nuclear transport factor 2 family protein [Aquincola sp.]MDH5330070.1 nuclear transport factor 2 family protein [Aquincola sp.]
MTRSALVGAVSIAAFAVSCLAMGADTNMSGATPLSEEQRVAALEDEWLEAEVKHDEATLRRVIGDRYTMNLANGMTLGKEQYIADILSETMLSASITERTVLVEGDTAVTFGTVNVVVPPVDGKDSAPSSARYTLVYVKRDGQWRALAFHIGKRSDN